MRWLRHLNIVENFVNWTQVLGNFLYKSWMKLIIASLEKAIRLCCISLRNPSRWRLRSISGSQVWGWRIEAMTRRQLNEKVSLQMAWLMPWHITMDGRRMCVDNICSGRDIACGLIYCFYVFNQGWCCGRNVAFHSVIVILVKRRER